MKADAVWRGACLAASVFLAGCAGDVDGAAGGDLTFGGDDTGSASGAGGDQPPPEDEDEGDFRVPEASGRFVYSASEATDSVAVIDSSSLAIRVAGVGRGPTVVAALGTPASDEGAVAVLDQGSDDVAILRTDADMATTVDVFAVTPGANNLAVTPDGRHVFVYHDIDGPEALGPGSNQEVTVVDAMTGETHGMTVGSHPRDIRFSTDGARAYVVTADGVNVIALAAVAMLGKPQLIPVVADPGIDPARVEVQLSVSRNVALARIEGDPTLTATDLETGVQTVLELPGIPTDLDVSDDGSFAIVMMPAQGGSTFAELVLPVDGSSSLELTTIQDEYLGLARIAPAGDKMVLYTTVDPRAHEISWTPENLLGGGFAMATDGDTDATGTSTGGESGSSTDTGGSTSETTSGGEPGTDDGDTTAGDPPVGPDPRQRITIARREGGAWTDLVTLFVERPVTAVGIAPDGASAILLHAEPVMGPDPFAYSIVDLAKTFPVKKLQRVPARPGSVMFTPDAQRSVVLLRDDEIDVRDLDLVDLRSFIVGRLKLGSPPEGAGYVDVTRKIFVSQEHLTGRITFVDPAGQVQTITGFRLNDAVKD
jgi:DNA-binding beta-propeller fold protein YncE